jgi:hypothetical protein
MPAKPGKSPSPYKRILIPSLGACPSAAQLKQGASLAARDRATVQVMQIVESQSTFEPDGPVGLLAVRRNVRRLAAACKRLDIHLARSRLSGVRSSVLCGEPDTLLARALRQWQPDLVIVAAGQARAPWILQAMVAAAVALPEILPAHS